MSLNPSNTSDNLATNAVSPEAASWKIAIFVEAHGKTIASAPKVVSVPEICGPTDESVVDYIHRE